MNFKQVVNDYFTFSRNERRGIVILLVFIFLMAIANQLIFYFETPAEIDPNLLDAFSEKAVQPEISIAETQTEETLFQFDPNAIDDVELESLDIPDNIKKNLLKFRQKGGKFISKDDFRKIYGMNDSIFSVVVPFLLLNNHTDASADKNLLFDVFPFDPNLADDSTFSRLGFSRKQINTIRNFLSKGGHFKNEADFFKIYGISDEQKTRVKGFVVINSPANQTVNETKNTEILSIDINSADSLELIKLPGIGPVLSKRIVKYRESLGGFYDLAQLNEVYGLQDQLSTRTKAMLKCNVFAIQKIDINFAEQKELARHPYIRSDKAQKIVNFRKKYGFINDPVVLRDSSIFSNKDYEKIKPYF